MEKEQEYMGIQYPSTPTPTRKAPDKADNNAILPQDKRGENNKQQGKTADKELAERTKPETPLSEAAYDKIIQDMPEQRDTAGTVATLQGVPMLYPNEMPKKKPRTRTFKKTVKNKLL
jgi:hypothetical protein